MSIFYVYEHWRPDQDRPFYVGKGAKNRAYRFKRNASYNAVIDLLNAAGMCVEVRLVASGLTEDAAFEIEIERIKFWRGNGVQLANRTDGGDGFSGFIRPTGIKLSETAKKKLSAARKGIRFSPEHRAKLADRKVGVKRKPFTVETIEKMKTAARRRESRKREAYGDAVTRWSRVPA